MAEDSLKPGCVLCRATDEDIIVQNDKWRIIFVDDVHYPGFCRVIWKKHIREMTDLSLEDRQVLMQAVWHVETALRKVMQPDKINIASLGNQVSHLHWHIIPRFNDDVHFPDPIWAAAKRSAKADRLDSRKSLLPELRKTIIALCQNSY